MKKVIISALFLASFGVAVAQMTPGGISIDSYRLMMERYSGGQGGLCPQTINEEVFSGCKPVSSLGYRYEGGSFFGNAHHCLYLKGNQDYCAKANTGQKGSCWERRDDCIGSSYLGMNCRPKCEFTSTKPFCMDKKECTGATAKSYCTKVYINMPRTVFRACPQPQNQCGRINDLDLNDNERARKCTALGCRFLEGKCIDSQISRCVRGRKCDNDSDCHNTPDTPKCEDVSPVGGLIEMHCTNGSPSCHEARCLSSTSVIATPIGDVPVTDLRVGDIVWTVDEGGGRVVRPLIRVSRVPAPNHRVVHLVLADGRALDVSASHPTANGKTVGGLRVGDTYNGSIVKSVAVKAYEGTATYDILPAGDSGYYWANGMLMGSTLK